MMMQNTTRKTTTAPTMTGVAMRSRTARTTPRADISCSSAVLAILFMTITVLLFDANRDDISGFASGFVGRRFATPTAVCSDLNNNNNNNNDDNNYCRSSNLNLSILFMGSKGGGKGDRKKKKVSAASSAPSATTARSPTTAGSPPQQPAPAPARVLTSINVPIRAQIAYGKLNKQYRESSGQTSYTRKTVNGKSKRIGGGGPPVKIQRTKYRKHLNETTIQEKALERQKKGQDPNWDVILNQTKADPLVLVDGYNIIYKWPRSKRQMTKGKPSIARQNLLDDLEGLAMLRQWRIECVFDGAGRGGHQPDPFGYERYTGTTTEPFGPTGSVRTVFTGRGIEADTYIEKRCLSAKSVTGGHITSSLIVATDDQQIKLCALNAGALCMSAYVMVNELKAVKKGIQYTVEKAMAEANNEPIRHQKFWGTSPDESGSTISASSSFRTRNTKQETREILNDKKKKRGKWIALGG